MDETFIKAMKLISNVKFEKVEENSDDDAYESVDSNDFSRIMNACYSGLLSEIRNLEDDLSKSDVVSENSDNPDFINALDTLNNIKSNIDNKD